MVITGTPDRMPERIGRIVYIDSVVPKDGDSPFGIMEQCGAGYQKFGLVPDKPFVDTLAFDEEKIRTIPKTCIHYTKSEFLPVGKEAYADVLKNARRDHWA